LVRIVKLFGLALVIYLVSLTMKANSLFILLFMKTILVLCFPFVLFFLQFYTPREISKIKEIAPTVARFLKLTH